MFLIPFLKYLKPFKWRLMIGFFCMFVVGSLGAVNIIMLKFPLEILLEEQGESIAGMKIPGLDGGLTGAVSGGDGQKTESGDAKTTESFSLTNILPAGLVEWWEGEMSGPREYLKTKETAIREWYRNLAATSPHSVLFLLSGFLLGMTLIKCVAEYVANYQMAHTFYFVNMRIREDIYRNVLAQDYLYFLRKSPGFLMSRIHSDVGAIKSIIDKLLTDGIQQPITLICYFLALIYISPRMTLLVIVALPPIGLILYNFNRVLRKNTRKQKEKADELSGSMSESMFNIRLVKAFGTEEIEIGKFLNRSMVLFRYVMDKRLAKFASGPVMEFLGTVMACMILIVGGYMILGDGLAFVGNISPADFMIYLFLLTRFYRPIKALSATTLNYQVARISGERIQEMLALRPRVKEIENPLPFTELKFGIQFESVTLKYKKDPALRNVNIFIPRGKMTALVGKAGAGKTTLANMVPRLFDPTEGRILIDGEDMKNYSLKQLRSRLGIVTQQTVLFDDTIANNIAYGIDDSHLTPEQRMEKIVAAAKAAYADEYIRELDGKRGYETRLGTGAGRLSGGQAQRIAIARAIYRNPEILILDEATSALDSDSQAKVQAGINNLLEGRTALVIAHRFSTIRNADNIVVLNKGEVAEQGTHDELLALRGIYWSLYQKDDQTIADDEEEITESDADAVTANNDLSDEND